MPRVLYDKSVKTDSVRTWCLEYEPCRQAGPMWGPDAVRQEQVQARRPRGRARQQLISNPHVIAVVWVWVEARVGRG